MVDIHIITHPKFDVSRQLARLQHRSVTSHLVEFAPGNILQGRITGFSMGHSDLVSWVDPDDKVLDVSWIDSAADIMKDPTVIAVYPRWIAIRGNKTEVMTPLHSWPPSGKSHFAHHLTIMRRAPVLAFLRRLKDAVGWTVTCQERLLLDHLARHGKMVALPNMAYQWNLRDGAAHTLRENPEVAARYQDVVAW